MVNRTLLLSALFNATIAVTVLGYSTWTLIVLFQHVDIKSLPWMECKSIQPYLLLSSIVSIAIFSILMTNALYRLRRAIVSTGRSQLDWFDASMEDSMEMDGAEGTRVTNGTIGGGGGSGGSGLLRAGSAHTLLLTITSITILLWGMFILSAEHSTQCSTIRGPPLSQLWLLFQITLWGDVCLIVYCTCCTFSHVNVSDSNNVADGEVGSNGNSNQFSTHAANFHNYQYEGNEETGAATASVAATPPPEEHTYDRAEGGTRGEQTSSEWARAGPITSINSNRSSRERNEDHEKAHHPHHHHATNTNTNVTGASSSSSSSGPMVDIPLSPVTLEERLLPTGRRVHF